VKLCSLCGVEAPVILATTCFACTTAREKEEIKVRWAQFSAEEKLERMHRYGQERAALKETK
jgi:predicted Fe-S protein YdhL (DUF1289 family)